MPKRTDLKSILILGSGPIVIGQAAEFDYSGRRRCARFEKRVPRDLAQQQPATIMTSREAEAASQPLYVDDQPKSERSRCPGLNLKAVRSPLRSR